MRSAEQIEILLNAKTKSVLTKTERLMVKLGIADSSDFARKAFFEDENGYTVEFTYEDGVLVAFEHHVPDAFPGFGG